MKRNASLTWLIVILACAVRASCEDTLVFDSHGPPASGGYSSPNGGLTTQLSVTEQLTVSRVAILNQMLAPGYVRFAILSYPEPQFLYLSDAKPFEKDLSGQQTWKMSDPLNFRFEAGSTYLVGYLHDVAVADYFNHQIESSAGITSDLISHTLRGFSDPIYSHKFLIGGDQSLRLYVPEPGSAILFAGLLPVLVRPRWRLPGSDRCLRR